MFKYLFILFTYIFFIYLLFGSQTAMLRIIPGSTLRNADSAQGTVWDNRVQTQVDRVPWETPFLLCYSSGTGFLS